jgi:hypothetical protein
VVRGLGEVHQDHVVGHGDGVVLLHLAGQAGVDGVSRGQPVAPEALFTVGKPTERLERNARRWRL